MWDKSRHRFQCPLGCEVRAVTRSLSIAVFSFLALSLVVGCGSTQKTEPSATTKIAADSAENDVKKDARVNDALVAMPESKPLYFEFNAVQLSDDATGRLQDIARYMTEHDAAKVTIEGHADERGTPEYNLALAEGRANAAKEYLQKLGVAADRIRVISYGEERPAVAEATDEDEHAKNRRDEFSLQLDTETAAVTPNG